MLFGIGRDGGLQESGMPLFAKMSTLSWLALSLVYESNLYEQVQQRPDMVTRVFLDQVRGGSRGGFGEG